MTAAPRGEDDVGGGHRSGYAPDASARLAVGGDGADDPDDVPVDPQLTVCERSDFAALRAVFLHSGFGAAARAVKIAPGTLLRRVRRLERSLATTLIVTIDQRSVVTAAGRVAVE